MRVGVELRATGSACTSVLKHHAAPDCGKGMAVFGPNCALHLWSVGQRPPVPPPKTCGSFAFAGNFPKFAPRALPPRCACLPPAHGPKATFFAGNFPKHFPRRREAQRTRGESVREGKTQLSGLVRMAHVMRGMAMPEGTDPHGFSQKPGGVGNTARRDHLRKGCSGGMEGGAGGETQFPITHPPSPVWKTQLQTS